MGRVQEAAASRMVGGSATPAARRARVAAGRGAERTMKCLLSYSISVSVNESRSAMVSGQELKRLEHGNPLFQLLLQHQREEAAEHVATDGLVQLVEDRPGESAGALRFEKSAPPSTTACSRAWPQAG